MSIETRLHILANSAQNLLGCEASLLLGCSDATLRHPLLNLFSAHRSGSVVQYGSPLDEHFLSALSALCDWVLQTGRIWEGNCFVAHDSPGVLVAPVERPSGLLGLLVFVATQPDAFLHGESLLVEQYLPAFARQMEKMLHDASASDVDALVTGIREQSQFISLVSHELRVPLTAIKGYAGLLQAYGCNEFALKEMTQTRQRQYLDSIMEQVDHLEVLISDLLDASRIQAGRLSLRRTWMHVAPLCERVLRVMQERVNRQQRATYCLRCDIDPALPPVWADPDRVQQVVTNLVENAIKYSPDGGIIEILAYPCPAQANDLSYLPPCTPLPSSDVELFHAAGTQLQEATQASPRICILVRDRGIGIPRSLQNTLFRPFTRLEHSATHRVNGAGLGLYISRKLVEAMDGRIMLLSNEGEGTSVFFTLPAMCVSNIPLFPACYQKSFG